MAERVRCPVFCTFCRSSIGVLLLDEPVSTQAIHTGTEQLRQAHKLVCDQVRAGKQLPGAVGVA